MSDKDTCSVPPALTEDELTAYLAGQAESHVKAHLESCTFCRAQLDDMRFGNLLNSVLHRFDCPDSQQLTDYVMQQLPSDERETMQKHLVFCLSCRDEIKVLQDFLETEIEENDIALPETSTIHPKRWHPEDHLARVSKVPIASELRGRHQGPILASVSDTLNIFLEFKESVQATTLKGQIVTDDITIWQSAMVTIFHDLKLITTTTVDEWGAFQYDLAAILPVQIRITAASGATISIPELMLDEEN